MIAFFASLSFLAGLSLRTLTGVSFLSLDNNDLAHFYGALGLVTLLVLALSNEVPRRHATGGFVALAAMTVASFAGARWYFPDLQALHVPYLAVAWIFLPLVALFGLFLRLLDAYSKFSGRGPFAPLQTVHLVGIPVIFSVWWELVIQPNFDVYGGEARGYVQWAQFIADQMACLLVWGLWKAVEWQSCRAGK